MSSVIYIMITIIEPNNLLILIIIIVEVQSKLFYNITKGADGQLEIT